MYINHSDASFRVIAPPLPETAANLTVEKEKTDKPLSHLASFIRSITRGKIGAISKKEFSNVKNQINFTVNHTSKAGVQLSHYIEENFDYIFHMPEIEDPGRSFLDRVKELKNELTEISRAVSNEVIDDSLMMMDKLRQVREEGFKFLKEIDHEVNKFFAGFPDRKKFKELEKELNQVVGKIVFQNYQTKLKLEQLKKDILNDLKQFGPLQEEAIVTVQKEVVDESDPAKKKTIEVQKKIQAYSKVPLNDKMTLFAQENQQYIQKQIQNDYLVFLSGESKINPHEQTYEQNVRKAIQNFYDNKIVEHVETKLSSLNVFSERSVIKELSPKGKTRLLKLYDKVLNNAFKRGQLAYEKLKSDPKNLELIKELNESSHILTNVQRNLFSKSKKQFWQEKTRPEMNNWLAVLDKTHKYSNKVL